MMLSMCKNLKGIFRFPLWLMRLFEMSIFAKIKLLKFLKEKNEIWSWPWVWILLFEIKQSWMISRLVFVNLNTPFRDMLNSWPHKLNAFNFEVLNVLMSNISGKSWTEEPLFWTSILFMLIWPISHLWVRNSNLK